jgi:DNA-directed RNA polymerase subunit M/transcription elongation factor TFIIS
MTDYNDSGQEGTDLEPSTDERRAEWERFTTVVLGGDGGGYVNIRNDSHDNPDEHIHSVHVANGEADGCSCPHATYRDAHCKHQRAVEQRPLVLSSADAASAATTSQQVAADGGTRQVARTDDSDTEPDDNQTDTTTSDDENRPQTDHWDQPVTHFDDEAVGAGEKRQCQSCGSRFEVSMIAATENNSRNWEEFYKCQNCGVRGSFRFYGKRDTREWTGRIAYPDE